jgi:hypothetical protein
MKKIWHFLTSMFTAFVSTASNDPEQFLREEFEDDNRKYWQEHDPRMYGFHGKPQKGRRKCPSQRHN